MKKRIIAISVSVALMMGMNIQTYAKYEPPAKIWASFNKYAAALEAKDYENIIKYGLIDVSILENEPVNDTTQSWLCARYQNIGNAYEKLGDYENSGRMYKKQIELANTIGWYDSAKIAKAKSLHYISDVRLFQKMYDKQKYYGAKNEHEKGVLYGMSADSATDQSKCSAKLIYLEYGDTNFDWIKSELKTANERKQAVEFALNLPNQGNDIQRVINGKDYIETVASMLSDYPNIKYFLRFGAEFDIWDLSANPEEYKKAFRTVADIIHKKVPNAAMVFSPNMVSSWNVNVEDYYPGDAYVDWVGMSLYMHKYFLGDANRSEDTKYMEVVFGTGDSASPVENAKKIIDLYGDRKPIMISECGASHTIRSANENATLWALNRVEKIYTYLPMVYPQIKLMLYFDTVMPNETNDYALKTNSQMKNLFEKITSGEIFIQKSAENNGLISYKELTNTIYSDGNPLEISAYPHIFKQDNLKVNYYLDEVWLGASTQIPYEKTIDMSKASNGEHKLRVSVEANGAEVYSENYKVIVNKAKDISVKVNGENISFSQKPVIIGGRTLVPLRAIFASLGAEVNWEQSTKTAIATKGSDTIKISIGSNELNKSGEIRLLDVPAKLINDNTMVPARAVAEAFGAEVGWDGESRTVIINYNN